MIEAYRFNTVTEAYAFYGGIKLCDDPRMEVLGLAKSDNKWCVIVLNDLDHDEPFTSVAKQGEIPFLSVHLEQLPLLNMEELKQDEFFETTEETDDQMTGPTDDVPPDPEFSGPVEPSDPSAAETQELFPDDYIRVSER
jgi:hypothetical protein